MPSATLRRWNGKTQSFEDVSYDGYKAKREAMPEDLRRQIPYIRRALEALRIPILQAEGFEADDVIGTLAREAAEQQHEVFIVSGDKDMMQLVTPAGEDPQPAKRQSDPRSRQGRPRRSACRPRRSST